MQRQSSHRVLFGETGDRGLIARGAEEARAKARRLIRKQPSRDSVLYVHNVASCRVSPSRSDLA